MSSRRPQQLGIAEGRQREQRAERFRVPAARQSANTLEAGQSTTHHERGGHRDLQGRRQRRPDAHRFRARSRRAPTSSNRCRPVSRRRPTPCPAGRHPQGQSSQRRSDQEPSICSPIPRSSATTPRPARCSVSTSICRPTIRARSIRPSRPISVPGDPASVGLNLGYNGNQLDLSGRLRDDGLCLQRDDRRAVGSFHHARASQRDRLDRYGHRSWQQRDQPAPDDQPGREPANRSRSSRPRAIRSRSRPPPGSRCWAA